jgi:hypothetical protein
MIYLIIASSFCLVFGLVVLYFVEKNEKKAQKQ